MSTWFDKLTTNGLLPIALSRELVERSKGKYRI